MKRNWSTDELIDCWTLLPLETALLDNKSGPTRLGFALLFKFFQLEARFPNAKNEIPRVVVAFVAWQVGVLPDEYLRYDWRGRTIKYHRAQIREYFGFREFTLADESDLKRWLGDEVLRRDQDRDHLEALIAGRLRQLQLEPPTPERLKRLLNSALHSHEERLFSRITARLSSRTKQHLDELIRPTNSAATTSTEVANAETAAEERPYWLELRHDPGRPSLQTALDEINKLLHLRQLELPNDLFADLAPKVLTAYRQRAVAEELFELRRHPADIRYTLLAVYCHLRRQEITDNLVDLLIDIVHAIGARAEKKVIQQFLGELRQVPGKSALFGQLAAALIANPDGVVREVAFPVISEETLQRIAEEYKASRTYQQEVQLHMRSSYSQHYRRMVPHLLEVLEFCSNNTMHRPLVAALSLLKKYAESSLQYYPPGESVPVEGVIRSLWRPIVIGDDKHGQPRLNRINYELCVLETLREQLRCKEIWVVGANRYRNPEEDLPADFDLQRTAYYAALGQPLDAETFVCDLQAQMIRELEELDRTLPQTPKVRILKKAGGWISVAALEPQPEPRNLGQLKAAVAERWPMTSLLDILKEVDLRVDFTANFKSATVRENLERETVRKRLLLCLYALGTNAGLKRVSAGDHGETYRDLQYVRRRYIDREELRAANAAVANAIFAIRAPHIWGEGTTACASDSKKFAAYDQNLLTEWHIRYRGPGVLVYWSLERHAVCIYSQLKSCSSSEVAAMLEGLLRHCTTMQVEKNYVDTHGQSEVAFGFCKLLGFDLLPRLKAIHAQRLYRPETGQPDAYPNLQLVLTRPIDWLLIRQQYDQMMKYATALRLGTAEAEAILRRFTRSNLQHPTYRALAELGKVMKTIFLCRYLRSQELRQEIHAGLNILESWNSVNSFIFYGRGGELATNNRADQELGLLGLQLVQNCLVYVNVLMLQEVLAEPGRLERMKPEDMRALTPLLYNHVNPYGVFRLNMAERIPLAQEVA